MVAPDPEQYQIPPNEFAPNSSLPVLIYRDVLPLPLSEDKVTEFLESHDWEKRGVWGHIPRRHFHPNSHECYGAFVFCYFCLYSCAACVHLSGVMGVFFMGSDRGGHHRRLSRQLDFTARLRSKRHRRRTTSRPLCGRRDCASGRDGALQSREHHGLPIHWSLP